MTLTDQLADALGVTYDEAAREVEDSGLAQLDSIERHAICEGCGCFKYEHLPEDNYGPDCKLS